MDDIAGVVKVVEVVVVGDDGVGLSVCVYLVVRMGSVSE